VFNRSDNAINVRSQASTRSESLIVGKLPAGYAADVLRQVRSSADGRIWFYISAQIEGASLTGWVRIDLVTQIDNCGTIDG
jgi:hypothetical protein